MGEGRQRRRLPGEALRPPRWRIAVDFVLVAGLVALLGLAVPLLTGWPAPVRRWEETIFTSGAWRVVNVFVIVWTGYRATVTAAPGPHADRTGLSARHERLRHRRRSRTWSRQ